MYLGDATGQLVLLRVTISKFESLQKRRLLVENSWIAVENALMRYKDSNFNNMIVLGGNEETVLKHCSGTLLSDEQLARLFSLIP